MSHPSSILHRLRYHASPAVCPVADTGQPGATARSCSFLLGTFASTAGERLSATRGRGYVRRRSALVALQCPRASVQSLGLWQGSISSLLSGA